MLQPELLLVEPLDTFCHRRHLNFLFAIICISMKILFGDHLDWGTYGRLLASLLSAVANVGTAGKGAGGPKSLY